MKAHFIQCSIDKVAYLRGDEIHNHPVNLAHCTSVQKARVNWYPDNEGIPSIRFNGCQIEWAYKSEEMRDRDYNAIVNNEV